jgi:DNA-binding Lrp family transcriptional regulator
MILGGVEEQFVPTAFILINARIGLENSILSRVTEIEGVEEAHAVYGVYDIIAKIEADSMEIIKEIVTWRIRRIENVKSTLTMLVIE